MDIDFSLSPDIPITIVILIIIAIVFFLVRYREKQVEEATSQNLKKAISTNSYKEKNKANKNQIEVWRFSIIFLIGFVLAVTMVVIYFSK